MPYRIHTNEKKSQIMGDHWQDVIRWGKEHPEEYQLARMIEPIIAKGNVFEGIKAE